jgi:hypothetical protein
MPNNLPTNFRQTRRRQEKIILILVIVVLVGVGTGLIGLIWGPFQALQGALCLLAGAALITGLWFLLRLLETWVNREE